MTTARFPRHRTPLNRPAVSRTFAAVDSDERDVEIFERIPWEALDKPGDRRWMVYLAATALVMVALGVTVGRSMGGPPAAAPSTTLAQPPVPSPPAAAPTTSPAVTAPEISTSWSEADLMAVPAESLEGVAGAMGEWFVVDFFTREGAEGGDRSFVEWSAVVAREWVSSSALDLTVVLRRLAATGDDAYQRLPVEGWVVSLELGDEGWVVVDGPVSVPAPDLAVDISDLDDKPPATVVAAVDDGEVTSGTESDEGWLVEVDWTDAAGLEWVVRRRIEPET